MEKSGSKNSGFPSSAGIVEAAKRIAGYIHRTPVFASESIDRIAGCKLVFKCENFQKAGAFKMRGALNAILSLTEEERSRGVATHSSGNHAQAVALAAKMLGIPAFVVMPENSSPVKANAAKGYGAQLRFCKPTLQAREEELQKVVERTGAVFIPPYDDYRIIAGQATAAMELIEDFPGLDIIMAPVGGGGLLSGTALSVHYFGKNIRTIAGEPEGAADACESIRKGEIVPSVNPVTIADGLLTSLGKKNFRIIQKFVSGIWLASDREILDAMILVWERMKIVIEPSAAVPLAALLKNKEKVAGRKVGVILSGGNYDIGRLFGKRHPLENTG